MTIYLSNICFVFVDEQAMVTASDCNKSEYILNGM